MEHTRHPLLIRADANSAIGTGHVMRCLALAQEWLAQGGQVVFVTACESPALRKRLSDEGCQVISVPQSHPHPSDWQTLGVALAAYPEAWTVLDGYNFDPAYQKQVKNAGHRLLVIDDMAHLDRYYADVVLNQNIYATELQYACELQPRLLLGTEYVLLRREFRPWRGWQREVPELARKILVTLGGSDPDNKTREVMRALSEIDIDGIEVIFVVGASNPHTEELKSAAVSMPYATRLLQNAANMPELMAWADVAISGIGSTCWEMLFMGLPMIGLILAENQRLAAATLSAQGLIRLLGETLQLDTHQLCLAVVELLNDFPTRDKIARLAPRLVDGLGPSRVIHCVQGESTHIR